MRSLNETNTRNAAQDTRNGSSSRSKQQSQINSPWTALISPSKGFFGQAGHNESFLLPTAPINVAFKTRTAMSQANHSQIKPRSNKKRHPQLNKWNATLTFLGESFHCSTQRRVANILSASGLTVPGTKPQVDSTLLLHKETRQRDQKMITK